MNLELVPCSTPKGRHIQERSQCFYLGETGYLFCIPESCSAFLDEDNKVLQVLAEEMNLLPPNVKQRVTNKFYAACKKAYTKPFALLPIRPVP